MERRGGVEKQVSKVFGKFFSFNELTTLTLILSCVGSDRGHSDG